MEFSTVKSASSKQVTANIIETIRKEDPSFWPYGVSVRHHDGGLFLIREASSKEPIGFTGWQKRNDGMKKVAYYSIGILPEHRSKGYAKEAVGMLREKLASEVDEVRAFILPHNKPSIALAESLDIPIEYEVRKEAHVKEANPFSWLAKPAVRSLVGGGAGAGLGTAMWGQPDQVRDNPLGAALGIGANALLGSHIAKLPAGSKMGFKDLMYAMAVGTGANALPKIHATARKSDEMMDQVNWSMKDFTEGINKSTESLVENPTLKSINQLVEDHPEKLVWGTLGVGAAIPLIAAMANYTSHKRTKALTDLSADLENLQTKAQEEMEPFRQKQAEKVASWSAIASRLPGLIGAGAGAGVGAGVNEIMYPEARATTNDPLGKMVNMASLIFAGHHLGRATKGGISPRVSRRLVRDAAVASSFGPLLGSLATNIRDTADSTSNMLNEQMKDLSKTMGNLGSPFSGIASFKDYWERNKDWLMPATMISHLIPLGIWAHSNYKKDKGIHDMTEHFIDNQERYLDAHAPKLNTGVPEEVDDEAVKEATAGGALSKLINHLARRSNIYGGLSGGAANAAVWDAAMYGDNPIENMTPKRGLESLFSFLGGSLAGGAGARSLSKVDKTGGRLSADQIGKLNTQAKISLLLTPGERALVSGSNFFSRGSSLFGEQIDKLQNPDPVAPGSTSVGDLIKQHPGKAGLLALLGAGGVGYLGNRIAKALEKPNEISIDQKPDPGHLKITLPTKDPNDNETQVVLPLDAASTVNLSKSLQQTIGRDARRKLRSGSRERIRRRKPVEEKPEEDDNVIQFDKSASLSRVEQLLAELTA